MKNHFGRVQLYKSNVERHKTYVGWGIKSISHSPYALQCTFVYSYNNERIEHLGIVAGSYRA